MVTALRPRPGPARNYVFPEFSDERLPSGIRLLTAPVSKLPVVTVLALVDAGSANDMSGKEGIASLTAAALLEGTKAYNGIELAEKFEELGTSLESGADWDSAFLKITVMSDNLYAAARLLGEALNGPVFPEREIERLKAERLAEILQLETEPRGLADEKFSEFVYSAESRYSKPDEGSVESVSSLRRADVEEFYRLNYCSNATTVVVAGDVSHAEAARVVSDAFKDWRTGSAHREAVVVAPRSQRKSAHIVDKVDASQSELRVGHVGLPRKHPDFFPTLVMNAILGGLFGSRINLNLREVHGYTYGASSHYDWRRQAGPFVISTAVESEVTAPALAEIFLEVERIRSEKVSAEELSLAKDYLEGVFPIRYETTAAISSALGSLVIYDLPADYYDAYRDNIHRVSADDIIRAARSHVHPELFQTVIVGDARTIRTRLGELNLGELTIHKA